MTDRDAADRNLLDACVSCGLCLSSCPTYVVQPLEQLGPRGRITGMRLHADGHLPVDDPSYVESMETCVQCRACEDVCPSGVQFGRLMESARAEITAAKRDSSVVSVATVAERVAFLALANRSLLKLASAGMATLQALRLDRLLPANLRLPRRSWLADGLRPLRPGGRPSETAVPDAETAAVFRGCVMDQWFRPVHQAVVDVLCAAGQDTDTQRRGRCCGALSLHAGREDEARLLAQEVVQAHRGTSGPVVVDSAGCGAAMHEYGRLLGTREAADFAARVRDLTQVVSPTALPPMSVPAQRVGYLASCHQRNVQGVVEEPLALLRAIDGLEIVVPADAPRCCGAGGAFSVLQPELSQAIGDRLADSFHRIGVTHVISSNPGCILQLENLGFTVEHTAAMLARALKPSTAPAD